MGATVERFGAIDVAINNAAFGGNALFEQSDDAFVVRNERIRLNARSFQRCALGASVLINVSSMAGMIGGGPSSPGLTEAPSAFEYEPLGVRICTVAPGAYGTTRRTTSRANWTEGTQRSSRTRTHCATTSPRPLPRARRKRSAGSRCATERMPVHNPVGSDAQMLAGLIEASDRQTFLGNVRPLLMPAGDPA